MLYLRNCYHFIIGAPLIKKDCLKRFSISGAFVNQLIYSCAQKILTSKILRDWALVAVALRSVHLVLPASPKHLLIASIMYEN
jgi:hypothetical protein